MIKLKKYKNELFTTMIPPNYQKVCNEVDDYFDLIKYCFECIGDVKQAIANVNFYHKDAQYNIAHYNTSIKHLHRRINECYEHLKSLGNEKDISRVTNVYTTSIANERKG